MTAKQRYVSPLADKPQQNRLPFRWITPRLSAGASATTEMHPTPTRWTSAPLTSSPFTLKPHPPSPLYITGELSMWKKTYGKTGKDISVIAFGGMQSPSPRTSTPRPRSSPMPTPRASTTSIPRLSTVATRARRIYFGAAIKQFRGLVLHLHESAARPTVWSFAPSLERSLKHFNVDSIDFFHIWSLTSPHQLPERVAKGGIPGRPESERGRARRAPSSSPRT